MPGGKRRAIAAQVQHGAGDFLDLANAPHRVHGRGELGLAWVGLVGAAEHVGVDYRRAHGIHADTLLRVFDGCRLGQADHRVLAGAVDTHLRRRSQPRHRGCIDDHPTALGLQQGQLVLHAQPYALHVHAHDGIELRLATFSQPVLLNLDAGVVEGIVQPAKGGDQAFVQLAHLGVAGDVTGNEQRLATCGVNLRHRRLATQRVEVGHYHLQALAGERQGRCPAYTGSAAGDQRYLAGKGHAHCVLLRGWWGSEHSQPPSGRAASSHQRLGYHACQ
ncbi:hypothetical protein D3C80_1277040 [compost metagenome]